MPTPEEIAFQQDQLTNYQRNLRHLLNQAARSGGEDSASLKLKNEIDEQRRLIAQIEATLRDMGVTSDNAPATSTPLRMLALVAAPLVLRTPAGEQPVTPLAVQAELDAIAAACRHPEHPVAIDIRVEVATADALGRVFATTSEPFDILHFTGHGSVSEAGVALVLEDEQDLGAARLMGDDELRRLVGVNPCRLAFLSACHSAGLAEALLALGVKHVVAINAADAVLDPAARAFAERLYAALLAGKPVAEAFERAVDAVRSSDELRALFDPHTLQPASAGEPPKFRLLPADAAEHGKPLREHLPPGDLRLPSLRWEHTNLQPAPADPFVGRRRELYALARKLRDPQARCVAISGPGGMGKTALAEAAGRWQHERGRWPDGVWLVELRNIASASQARVQIATSLALDPKAAASDVALAAALREWRALLILDDLDVIRQTDNAGLTALLRALLGTRALRLLVTGRQNLSSQVSHERLELHRLDPTDALLAFHAYAPPPEQWGTWQPAELDALLQFLDGYPFPIRLASSYMDQNHCGLRDLLRQLQANPRGTLRYPGDEEDRTTSLAATLDLSFKALPPAAQTTLPLLALFPAGLSRDAARAVLGEASVEVLETLLRHSMAEYRDEAGYTRFALPEPARRYAEALQKPGAMEQYAPKALEFFHSFVDQTTDLVAAGQYQEGRVLLTLEGPNLKRFLDWGYDHEQRDDGKSLSARATAWLSAYHWAMIDTLHHPETLVSLQRALGAAQRNNDSWGEANVLIAIGDVQQFRKETDAALASYQQALTLFRAVGAKLGEANVLIAIGDVQQFRKETDAALASYQQALTLFRAVGDRLGEANVLKAIGDVQQFRKETDAALASYQQALTLYRAVGAKLGEANVLAAQSRLLIGEDPQQSQTLLAQAQKLREAIGDIYGAAVDQYNYALGLLNRERKAEALPYLRRARDLFASRGIEVWAQQAENLIAQAEDQADASDGDAQVE